MSKAAVGARVQYCGHDGYFVADIFEVAGANVVRANGPVTPGNLIRPAQQASKPATHWLSDMPSSGFWRPDLGVFVVPENQVRPMNEAEEDPPFEDDDSDPLGPPDWMGEEGP